MQVPNKKGKKKIEQVMKQITKLWKCFGVSIWVQNWGKVTVVSAMIMGLNI